MSPDLKKKKVLTHLSYKWFMCIIICIIQDHVFLAYFSFYHKECDSTGEVLFSFLWAVHMPDSTPPFNVCILQKSEI